MSSDYRSPTERSDYSDLRSLLALRPATQLIPEGGVGAPVATSPYRSAFRFSDRGFELRMDTARTDALPACWFEVDSRPCFILNIAGAVIGQNPAAGALLAAQVLSIRGGVLSFGRAQSDEALMEAIEAVARERSLRKHVVILGQDDVWRSLTLHLAPSERPVVFVSVRTQARTDDLAMEPLIEAFHLTPAQAKVVVGLAKGLVPKEIARRMDVSTHTVRTHLRAIYGKLKVRGIAGALRLTSQLLD